MIVVFLGIMIVLVAIHSINTRDMAIRDVNKLYKLIEGQAAWEEEKRAELAHNVYKLEESAEQRWSKL